MDLIYCHFILKALTSAVYIHSFAPDIHSSAVLVPNVVRAMMQSAQMPLVTAESFSVPPHMMLPKMRLTDKREAESAPPLRLLRDDVLYICIIVRVCLYRQEQEF